MKEGWSCCWSPANRSSPPGQKAEAWLVIGALPPLVLLLCDVSRHVPSDLWCVLLEAHQAVCRARPKRKGHGGREREKAR